MQERRTTVRMPCRLNAHYCLMPADGAPSTPCPHTLASVINLSQHGAGVRSAGRLNVGERVAMRLALPDEGQELTMSGLVRWSDGPAGFFGRWTAGVAFDPVDDTMQFRLNEFVAGRAHQAGTHDVEPSRLPPHLARTPSHLWQSLAPLILMAGLLLAVVLTQRSAARLRQNLADRSRVIQQLEAHHQLLLATLHDTQRRVEALTRQLGDLRQYSSEVEARAAAMAGQLEQTRQEYLRLSDDRERLRQELAAMQKRQATLEARFQSLPDLRQAMADLKQLKRHQEWQARREQQRQRDQAALTSGNRGYLVRTPPPTSEPTVSITVYPPEAVPAPPAAAADGATEALVYDP